MNKQYPIINKYWVLLIMEPETKSPEETTPQKTSLTIQRVLDNDSCQQEQKQRKQCSKCGIKQNEIRECSRTIIIQFEETNQMYCYTCLQQLLIQQQIQAKRLEEKFIYQKQFEASVSQSQIMYINASQEDVEGIKLQKQVETLEQQQNQIDYLLGKAKNQCKQLQEKVFNLEQKQEKFWSDMNKFQKRALKLEQKSFIAKNQGQIQKKSMDCLSRTSIIHTFFRIQIQDSYAQVYGLVIGKKPQQLDINWQQTNTGIGHLLLAFNYLILKYGLTYTRIQTIHIKGHMSEIQLRNTDSFFPVGFGVTIGSVTCNERIFGIIMECLLGEMGDLAQHIQQIQNIQYSQELQLPFTIDKKEGKILDLFVNPTKLQQKTKWMQWTKAMRYFLIDFKHILTIASLSDPYF